MKKCDSSPPLCNRCGKPLDSLDMNAIPEFDCFVGYGSKYDLEHIKAFLCIDCFDAMVDQAVKEFKISPFVEEPDYEEDIYEEIVKSEA